MGSIRHVVDIFISTIRTTETFQEGTVYPSSPRPPPSPASTEYSSPCPPNEVERMNALVCVCASRRGMSSPSLMHHFIESGRLVRETNICETGRLKRAQLLSVPTPPTLHCSESAPSSSLPLLLIALLFLLRSHLPPISLFFLSSGTSPPLCHLRRHRLHLITLLISLLLLCHSSSLFFSFLLLLFFQRRWVDSVAMTTAQRENWELIQ